MFSDEYEIENLKDGEVIKVTGKVNLKFTFTVFPRVSHPPPNRWLRFDI